MTYEEREKLKMRAQDFELNVPKAPPILATDIDFKKFRNLSGVKAKDDTQYVSKEQAKYFAQELIHCTNDPIYFAEKYFYIVSYKGKQIIKLFEKQKDMLRSFINNSFTVVCSARQAGKCVNYSTPITCKKDNKIFKTTIGQLFDNL